MFPFLPDMTEWMDKTSVDKFAHFARECFQTFGDRVCTGRVTFDKCV